MAAGGQDRHCDTPGPPRATSWRLYFQRWLPSPHQKPHWTVNALQNAGDACRTQPWLLQDGTGTVTHRGHLEGGLGGATSSAGYFILIKEGSAFTALPADQFYTFRPKQK